MLVSVPDPTYTTSPKSRQNFILAVKLATLLVALVWAVFLIDHLLPISLKAYGVRPREWSGLLGIFFAPLLHSNLGHLFSNTFPLYVGTILMLYLYPNAALKAFPFLYLGSGALAWSFARSSNHIGASGLVYGVLAFVFVAGIARRDIRSIAASLVIWFLYGSMVWGVLPTRPSVSWELHAAGFVMGIVTALIWRHSDRPPFKVYDWEQDQNEDSGELDQDGDLASDDEFNFDDEPSGDDELHLDDEPSGNDEFDMSQNEDERKRT